MVGERRKRPNLISIKKAHQPRGPNAATVRLKNLMEASGRRKEGACGREEFTTCILLPRRGFSMANILAK
jgi:hypothetical protein